MRDPVRGVNRSLGVTVLVALAFLLGAVASRAESGRGVDKNPGTELTETTTGTRAALQEGVAPASDRSDAEAISLELAGMFRDDQAERREGRMNAGRDRARLGRVRELLMTDRLITREDMFHAAMIFQHSTDRTGRDHLVAHVLATAAAFEGHKGARWLSAAALDRALEFSGQKQFFGTQMRRDGKGKWVGGDHDRYRTEALREAFGVGE